MVYNLKSVQTKKLDVVLSLDDSDLYGHLSYNMSSSILPESKSDVYNLYDGELVKQFSKPIAGYIKKITASYIITSKDGILYVYSNQDFSLLWQKDIGEMTQYNYLFGTIKRGNIRDIHEYKDGSIIVLTDIFIMRLNINTGDILYLQRLPRGLISISIIDNKAYGCYSSSYMEVDLDNGKVIKYLEMDKVESQGEKYDAEMGLNRLHAGYLYHGMRLEGGVFAIGAINIKTGIREWADVLGVYSVTRIQFYKDKMYINDGGRNLYILRGLYDCTGEKV